MRLSVYIVVVASMLITSACVQVIEPSKAEQTQLAVSSVWDVPTQLSKGSTFAILPKYLEKVSISSKEQQAYYQMYADAIRQAMLEQGFVHTQNQPDFVVNFGIALSDDLNDETMSKKFGITPGLQVGTDQQKGSFLIAVEEGVTNQRLWRGTVQGFVQEDFSKAERKKRVEKVVKMVLTQFYNAG